MRKPRIKICCISSIEEAQIAIENGASALGLVGPMPSGPGIIDNGLIKEIASYAPPGISTFLLTSETKAEDVIEHYKMVNTSTIQLVDALDDENYSELRRALPNVKLVQVIHVIDDNSVVEAKRISSHVDALLLDSGNPNLKVKELGGTGRVHNWDLSKRIVDECDAPVFLAGGIRPENIKEAFEYVRPFGIDLCSGVRSNGNLDPDKLRSLFRAIE